jgi:hypothetical protein
VPPPGSAPSAAVDPAPHWALRAPTSHARRSCAPAMAVRTSGKQSWPAPPALFARALPTPPCARVRARRSRAHVHRHRRLTRCARAPPMCAAAPATPLAAIVAFGRRQRKGRRKNEVGFREGGVFNWARPGSEGCFGPTNK